LAERRGKRKTLAKDWLNQKTSGLLLTVVEDKVGNGEKEKVRPIAELPFFAGGKELLLSSGDPTRSVVGPSTMPVATSRVPIRFLFRQTEPQ